MKTIKIQFQSNGETVKRTAIVNDCLNELSNSQRNQACDINNECWSDGFWSLFFEGEPGTQYEVEFEFDTENHRETLKPVKAITWVDDIIEDVQPVKVTVK